MNYWAQRMAQSQTALSNKNIKQINKQLSKYYQSAAKRVIEDFESTYNKLLAQMGEDKQPTPADLYKLDKYWQMQGQMRQELRRLGEKQIATLTKMFEISFFDIYYSIAVEGAQAFNTIDSAAALQLINGIWCADGKSWSERIWKNTDLLAERLNSELIHCVAAGKKTTELKRMLQEGFGVSHSRADALVRTEIAHIQTQAAAQRYKDYGLEKYEILGNDDDSCGNHSIDCHEMDGKVFLYSEMVVGTNAPPFHPRCKCCIVPVVE